MGSGERWEKREEGRGGAGGCTCGDRGGCRSGGAEVMVSGGSGEFGWARVRVRIRVRVLKRGRIGAC